MIINKKDFIEIEKKSKKFSFTSLKHVGYESLSEFIVIADDEDIILLRGENKGFALVQYHYAFNDVNRFLKLTENNTNFLITFVDDSLVDGLKKSGFETFAVWRDYFNYDISSYKKIEEYEHLKASDYKKASDITLACKNQSRGFMGQTQEWIADWMSGDNAEAKKIKMKDSTILTHYESGEIVGIICVGTYGHESEKGAVLWIADLAVHPDYQKRGIATKLIKQGLSYGKSHGAKRSFLMADDTNDNAIGLYKKMGFEPIEDEYEINMFKPC